MFLFFRFLFFNLILIKIDDSLFWDSFEQTAIWKLINSEFEGDSQMIEKILTKIIKKLHSSNFIYFILFSKPKNTSSRIIINSN